MAMAERRRASGQRDVHGVGGTARGGQRRLAFRERLLDVRLEPVHELAERAAIGGRQRRQLRHQVGHPPDLRPVQPIVSASSARARDAGARGVRLGERRANAASCSDDERRSASVGMEVDSGLAWFERLGLAALRVERL